MQRLKRLPNRQTIERKKNALAISLRTEWLFKLISLVTAITLYFYVQTERNPKAQRTISASISIENAPEGLDYEMDSRAVAVTISGVKSVVDRLKEGDVRAIADLHDIKRDNSQPQTTRLQIVFPNHAPKIVEGLLIDPPVFTLRLQVYPPITRPMDATLTYPQEPPLGYRYGDPETSPSSIRVAGRVERVNRVTKLVVNAAPPSPGERIQGEFPVIAQDKGGNVVEGVILQPASVRVSVPLIEESPSKIVPISPNIIELPPLPYTLTDIRATPSQIKLSGSPERLANIFTIETEPISLRDAVLNREQRVTLQIPPNVLLYDMNSRPITTVMLRITVRRTSAAPANITPNAPAGKSPETPKEGKTEPPPKPKEVGG